MWGRGGGRGVCGGGGGVIIVIPTNELTKGERDSQCVSMGRLTF